MAKRKPSKYKVKKKDRREQKKKQRLLKAVFEKKTHPRNKNETDVKLVKGLDNICAQIASLGVSAGSFDSQKLDLAKDGEAAVEAAFKKLALNGSSDELDVKLVKSLKSLTCEAPVKTEPKEEDQEETSAEFYKRQRQEYTKYCRRQGKKLRNSKRKVGKSYKVLEDLRATDH